MTPERLFNSFIPPPKKNYTPKTNFWLCPCSAEMMAAGDVNDMSTVSLKCVVVCLLNELTAVSAACRSSIARRELTVTLTSTLLSILLTLTA